MLEVFFKEFFGLVHDIVRHQDIQLAPFVGSVAEVVPHNLDDGALLGDIAPRILHQDGGEGRCYSLRNLGVPVVRELDKHGEEFLGDDIQIEQVDVVAETARQQRLSPPLRLWGRLIRALDHADVLGSLFLVNLVQEDVHGSEGAFTHLRVRIFEELIKRAD